MYYSVEGGTVRQENSKLMMIVRTKRTEVDCLPDWPRRWRAAAVLMRRARVTTDWSNTSLRCDTRRSLQAGRAANFGELETEHHSLALHRCCCLHNCSVRPGTAASEQGSTNWSSQAGALKLHSRVQSHTGLLRYTKLSDRSIFSFQQKRDRPAGLVWNWLE